MKILRYAGVLPLLVSCASCATSLGWKGEAVISSIEGAPAICLPDNASEDFPVYRVLLSESYIKDSRDWILYLKPGARPLTLRPGACLRFGVVPDGYEATADSSLHGLKVNSTYVFMMDRVRGEQHYNYFYSSTFCVKEIATGGLEYPQYTRLPNGSAVTPSCDSRLNGKAE